MTTNTMRAAVWTAIGGPEVLKIQNWPKPAPAKGEVLIRVKAAGLNRSEMFTRQGHSPGVEFPRILGIEATGIVESAPGTDIPEGSVAITCMGGLGRTLKDSGGYGAYVVVPATQVQTVKTKLGWDVLGALPEMIQTTWGSLFHALQLKSSDSLLIRGGTTSIGLAAAAIAKHHGCRVGATTRNPAREQFLKDHGVDEVFVDNGSIADEVRKRFPQGFSKVLELVGVTSLPDSLKCASEQGLVCITGIAGGKWTLDGVNPMLLIPTSVGLTVYAGGPDQFMNTPMQKVVDLVESGEMKIPVRAFPLEEIVEAHRLMEGKGAGAKMVVLHE